MRGTKTKSNHEFQTETISFIKAKMVLLPKVKKKLSLKKFDIQIFSVLRYRYTLKANLIQNFTQDTYARRTISLVLNMFAIFSL